MISNNTLMSQSIATKNKLAFKGLEISSTVKSNYDKNFNFIGYGDETCYRYQSKDGKNIAYTTQSHLSRDGEEFLNKMNTHIQYVNKKIDNTKKSAKPFWKQELADAIDGFKVMKEKFSSICFDELEKAQLVTKQKQASLNNFEQLEHQIKNLVKK